MSTSRTHSALLRILWLGFFMTLPVQASETPDTQELLSRYLLEKYEAAKQSGETMAEDVMVWIQQEQANWNRYDYKVERVPLGAPEKLTHQMQAQGETGMECFAVIPQEKEVYLFYKKRVDSTLRHLPFQDWLKLLHQLQFAENPS